MRLIVDTSVIIAVLVDEPSRPGLIEATRGKALLAPASVHWEVGNAFTAMLKKGRATVEQALEALEAYGDIPIRFVDVPVAEAVELAGRFNLYAYDAYVLACARALRAPILSLDAGLVRVAREMSLAVEEVP